MSELRETRRVLLDGNAVDVVRRGDELVAGDGRTVGVDEAAHLPPVNAVQDHLCPPELRLAGGRADEHAAAGADLLPQAGFGV